MNEKREMTAQKAIIIPWLQETYMAVPGTVHLSASEVYEKYAAHMKANFSSTDLLSKTQVTLVVKQIFPSVLVKKQHGMPIYTGLRLNFDTGNSSDKDDIIKIATDVGFSTLAVNESYLIFGCHTGYIVNNNEQLKTVKIKSDNTVIVSVGVRPIELYEIGLENISPCTTLKTRILFNTVKVAHVCCGKLVNSKLQTSKNGLVQEWKRLNDENSYELRLSAQKCHGIVPFTNNNPTCTVCRQQKLSSLIGPSPPSKYEDNRETLIRSLFPGNNDNMLNFLTSQSNICKNYSSGKDPRGRRWDRYTIQVALTLWNRSPQGYSSLRDSGMLFLPSESLLQRYKNCFLQQPGLNENMFAWMYTEFNKVKTDNHGGLILDEMAVQEDLQMSLGNGKNLVDGLVDMGELIQNISILNSQKQEVKIASHVMQFIFLSYDGFRFPFAYFPTVGANAPELYLTVWESISKLFAYDFVVDYVCFDGASNNRAFQFMHFSDKDDAKMKNFTTSNPYSKLNYSSKDTSGTDRI